MERLTARNEQGRAYFPPCFEAPCFGMGCAKECDLMDRVCEKLAQYEERDNELDTGAI